MGNLIDMLNRASAAAGDRLVANFPQMLEAMALLLAGWLIATVLRMVTAKSTGLIDALITKAVGPARWRVGRFGQVLGTIVYWVVVVFFVAAATQALGLQTFTNWLARLLDHLPTLAAGLLIIAVGYLLSGLVRDVVQATTGMLSPQQRTATARAAQGATLLVALLVGADQIGLKVTWLAILVALVLVCLLGGLALTISLGARTYVANLIGAHYMAQALQVGQSVRVAGFQGSVVELTATSLVLETPQGKVMLPGSVYHDGPIEVLVPES
jgi:hypothetical protein